MSIRRPLNLFVLLLGAAQWPVNAHAQESCVLLTGTTRASYFWDDNSGRNGDTGTTASGQPMHRGLAASPSWPLGTEGYVSHAGKQLPFVIGDRGPGTPSSDGIMLDLDGKTFAALSGGRWNSSTLTVEGTDGHLQVTYLVTHWGTGPGVKAEPRPFASGAWRVADRSTPECAQVQNGLMRQM